MRPWFEYGRLAIVGAGVVGIIGTLWIALDAGTRAQPLGPAASGGRSAPARAVGTKSADASPSRERAASLAKALQDELQILPAFSLGQGEVLSLATNTCSALEAIEDASGLAFEDGAMRHGLRLPKEIASGTPEHRLKYWQASTEYVRTLDLSTEQATLRIRDKKGRHLAGDSPGRQFSLVAQPADQADSTGPLYEVILKGVAHGQARETTKPAYLGLVMAHDAPDGSWRLCGITYYGLPQNKAMPIVPVAYPAKE